MRSSETAEEHLRVIRALMERSTIYRAISAPVALMGGIFGIVAGAVLWWIGGHSDMVEGDAGILLFVLTWLVGYVVVEGVNYLMIYRSARRRGESFFSPGLKHAVRSLAPPLFCGCVTGLSMAVILHDLGLCAIIWAIFFGLAMLSTSSFAPKSIVWLGRSFAVAGIVMLPCYLSFVEAGTNRFRLAALIMAVTFGLFHLIYAAAITGAHALRTELEEEESPSSRPDFSVENRTNKPLKSVS